jgi:predicted Zn-dependent protease
VLNVKAKKVQSAGLLEYRQGVLQPPARVAGNDDYLDEANKGRIVHWQSSRMPLRVYIHDPRGVPGFKARYYEILVKSFHDWTAASNGRVSFKLVDDPDARDLDCKFSPSPLEKDGVAAEGEAGEAKMYYGQDKKSADTYLQLGKVTLFTKSMSDVLPLTDNRMRTVCLHEIGHALGITGHTTNPDDIMFYSSSFKDEWRDLSGRDARTIQRLYSIK